MATSDRVDASLEWPLHAGVVLRRRCICQSSGTVSCAGNDSAADVSFARAVARRYSAAVWPAGCALAAPLIADHSVTVTY